MRAIFEVAWMTVVWSRPPNSLPILGSEESVSSRERYIATRRGKTMFCERFSLSVQELCSARRSQSVAYPRQVAMYLSRELTDASLPKIGKEFGGRDHTTVIHATSKIARMIKEDRSVYNLVQELTARIKQAH